MSTCEHSGNSIERDDPNAIALLRLLWKRPDCTIGMLIRELPAELRGMPLLIRCAANGLIEFGWSRLSWPADEDFDWENLEWHWHAAHAQSDTPYTQRMKDAARNTMGEGASVRLTARGEAAICDIFLGAELKPTDQSGTGLVGSAPAAFSIVNLEEGAKVIAEAIERIYKAHAPESNESVSVYEAHAILLKLAQENGAFKNCTRDQMAEAVRARSNKNCSPATISNTHFWKMCQQERKARSAIKRPVYLEKPKLEGLATKKSVVRGFRDSVTKEVAERRIWESELEQVDKQALFDKLELGNIDPAQAVEIVETLNRS